MNLQCSTWVLISSSNLFSLNAYNVVVMHNIDYLSAVIKLQMVYTGLSIKSREKAIVGASDKVQEKL